MTWKDYVVHRPETTGYRCRWSMGIFKPSVFSPMTEKARHQTPLEPVRWITSALDPELVGEVLQVAESLANEGMTLLMVAHEMNFARKVSNRVIFMHQGSVREMGPPAQLLGQPSTPELRQFPASVH